MSARRRKTPFGPGSALAMSALGACVFCLWSSGRGQGAAVPDSTGPYRVICEVDGAVDNRCRVDPATYVGWRTFQAFCSACHGEDGLGSAFAPNLLERVRRMGRRGFFAALDEGYTGRLTAMPPWGQNPNVNRYYSELWSYLIARANGDLPPGRLAQAPRGVSE